MNRWSPVILAADVGTVILAALLFTLRFEGLIVAPRAEKARDKWAERAVRTAGWGRAYEEGYGYVPLPKRKVMPAGRTSNRQGT